MSRTGRFVGGVAVRYANQVVVMVVGLALTPFLLKLIGQHDLGLWLIGMQLLSYLMLTDIGIFIMVPREIAYANGSSAGQESPDILRARVGKLTRLVLYLTPFVALAAFVLWRFMPGEWTEFRGPLAYVIFSFALFFPFRMFGAVLEGLQDISFHGKAQMISWSAGTLTNVGLVIAGFGLYSLAAGWIINQVVSFSLCGIRLWRRHPHAIPWMLPALPRTEVFHYLSRGGWITTSQVAQLLLSGTDLLFIGKLLGPGAVIPYTCTGKLISVLANQPYLLMETAVPGLSELKAGAEPNRILNASSALAQAVLFLSGGVCCVVLAVNAGFVSWWVGPSRYAGIALTVAILLNTLLRHWNLTMAYTNFCFQQEKRLALMALVDGSVTALSSYLLIRSFGLIGAPLGSIVGVCLVSLPSNASILTKEMQMPISRVLRPLAPWLWRFGLLIGVISLLAKYWNPDNFWKLAATTTFVCAMYAVVMARPLLQSPLGAYIQPMLDKAYSFARRRLWHVRTSSEAGPVS